MRVAVVQHGRQAVDFEAMALAGFGQHGDVAGAPGAVAEVVADHQPFHVQAVDQHALREFFAATSRRNVR
jgi:hypothetical protein